MMINKCKKQFEINRIGNTNCWIKNGFQHRGLINHFLAKQFINFGGPPVFKLHFFWRRRLINNGVLINPDLALYIYMEGSEVTSHENTPKSPKSWMTMN